MEGKTPDPQSTIKASVGGDGRPRPPSRIALVRAQVTRQLSRKLPYYLTPEEAHRIISASINARDHLLLRLLWETGGRISEAIALRLGDVSRDGIRVLGKGGVERVVFVQDSLINGILFYAQNVVGLGGKGGNTEPVWAVILCSCRSLFCTNRGLHRKKGKSGEGWWWRCRKCGVDSPIQVGIKSIQGQALKGK